MNPLLAVVLGAAIGAGAWIALAALVPWRPALATELDTYQTPKSSLAELPPTPTVRRGFPTAAIRSDLDCLGKPDTWLWRTMTRAALVGALGGAAFGLALNALAVTGPAAAFVLAPAGAVMAAAVTVIDLQQRARRERTEYRRALAVLLDQVAISLSSGAGIDTALGEALDVGTGPQFEAIRAALARAQLLGQTPWEAIGALGRRIGVTDYRQLAATISLAGTEGTRIRDALLARAGAMRTKLTAEDEAAAEQITERMTVPVVAWSIVTVLFILIPAAAQMLGQT